jgi:hypothetical protein
MSSGIPACFRHNWIKKLFNARFVGLLVDKKPLCGLGLSSSGGRVSDLSRSEKMLAEKTVCVLLVRGEDPDGAPIYAYVGVRADKLQAFMDAQNSGMFYPEEHGIIIESGQGEPNAEVRAKMEREYGFNHEGMLDIPDASDANRIAAQLSKQANNKDD